jgi:hypothetical protein
VGHRTACGIIRSWLCKNKATRVDTAKQKHAMPSVQYTAKQCEVGGPERRRHSPSEQTIILEREDWAFLSAPLHNHNIAVSWHVDVLVPASHAMWMQL